MSHTHTNLQCVPSLLVLSSPSRATKTQPQLYGKTSGLQGVGGKGL